MLGFRTVFYLLPMKKGAVDRDSMADSKNISDDALRTVVATYFQAHVSPSVESGEGGLVRAYAERIFALSKEAMSDESLLSGLDGSDGVLVAEILQMAKALASKQTEGGEGADEECDEQRATVTVIGKHPGAGENPAGKAHVVTTLRRSLGRKILNGIWRGVQRFGLPVMVATAGTVGGISAYLAHQEKAGKIRVYPDPLPDAIGLESNTEHGDALADALLQMIAILQESLPDDFPIKRTLASVTPDDIITFFEQFLDRHKNHPDILSKISSGDFPRLAVAQMETAAGRAYRDQNLIVFDADIDSKEHFLKVLAHEWHHTEVQGNNFPAMRVLREGYTELNAREMLSETEMETGGAYEKLTYRAFLLQMFGDDVLAGLYSGVYSPGDMETLRKNLGILGNQPINKAQNDELTRRINAFLEGEDDLTDIFKAAEAAVLETILDNSDGSQEGRRMARITAVLAMHNGVDVSTKLEEFFKIPMSEQESSAQFVDAMDQVEDQYSRTGRIEHLPEYFKPYLDPLTDEEKANMDKADNLDVKDEGEAVGYSPSLMKLLEAAAMMLLWFLTLQKINKRSKLAEGRLEEESALAMMKASGSRRFCQAFYLSSILNRGIAKPDFELAQNKGFRQYFQIVDGLRDNLEPGVAGRVKNILLTAMTTIGMTAFAAYFDILTLPGIITAIGSAQALRLMLSREYAHFLNINFNSSATMTRDMGRHLPGFSSEKILREAARPSRSAEKPIVFAIFELQPEYKGCIARSYRRMETVEGDDRCQFEVGYLEPKAKSNEKAIITLSEEQSLALDRQEWEFLPAIGEDPLAEAKIDVELMPGERIAGYFEFANDLYLVKVVNDSSSTQKAKLRLVPGPLYHGTIDEDFFHVDKYELVDTDLVKFEFVFRDKMSGGTVTVLEAKPKASGQSSMFFDFFGEDGRNHTLDELSHLVVAEEFETYADRVVFVQPGAAQKLAEEESEKLQQENQEMVLSRRGGGVDYRPRSTFCDRWEKKIYVEKPSGCEPGPPSCLRMGNLLLFTFTIRKSGERVSVVVLPDGRNVPGLKNLQLRRGARELGVCIEYRYRLRPSAAVSSSFEVLIDSDHGDLFRAVTPGRGQYPLDDDLSEGVEKTVSGMLRSFGLRFMKSAQPDEHSLSLFINGQLLELDKLRRRLPAQALMRTELSSLRANPPITSDPYGRKRREKPAPSNDPKVVNAHGYSVVKGRALHGQDSGDFESFQKYTPGADTRRIDWRVTARSSRAILVRNFVHSLQTDMPQKPIVVAVHGLICEDVYIELFKVLFDQAMKNGGKVSKSLILSAQRSGQMEVVSMQGLKIGNLVEFFNGVIDCSRAMIEKGNPFPKTERTSQFDRIIERKTFARRRQKVRVIDASKLSTVQRKVEIVVEKDSPSKVKLPQSVGREARYIGFL